MLLVVALVAIVGTLGACLLLVARLDRQTTEATADATQGRYVVDGVLAALLAERLADLHVSDQNVPYAALDADVSVAERQCIDYPDEACDPALACIQPYDQAGTLTWRHISHPPGSALEHTTDVATADSALVDTDGDGVGDARLFPAGLKARDGNDYLAAVRMIDAAGLLNVNVANHPRPAAAGQIMDPSDLALAALAEALDVQGLRAARQSGPFDLSDMLALTWRAGGSGATATGRLSGCLLDDGAAGRLTILSASRLAVPRRGADLPTGCVNVNAAAAAGDFPALFRAFRALLDDGRGAVDLNPEAAQLAVNVIDFVDADDQVTAARVPGVAGQFMVYGVERQPFLTEMFHYEQADPCAKTFTQRSAIELLNPYATAINLAGYSLVNQGRIYDLSGTIPANGRLVVRSADWGPVGQSLELDDSFTTAAAVDLCRLAPDGMRIPLDTAEGLFVMLPPDQPGENWRVRQRDDDPARARYCVRAEHVYTGDQVASTRYVGSDGRVAERNNLGAPNSLDPIFGPILEAIDAPRRPVYVRNGPLLNLGELATRILRVGATAPEPQPISDSLRQGEADVWLSLGGNPATIPDGACPRVPVGCAVGDYLAVRATSALPEPVQGMVNINTAPPGVLRCLSALSNLPQAERDAVVEEILAYRDKTAIPSGRDYATHPRGDPSAAGVPGLRDEPGFATAGEIAIPLALAGGARETYSDTPPAPYAVGPLGSDDGLGNPSAAPPGFPQGDYAKRHVLYCWLSNQVTVRSDTFIAYICIHKANLPHAAGRYYVAVIDRSRCPANGALPAVVLFSQIR